MKANIFGLISICGLILFGYGIAISPLWFKCLFFGVLVFIIGGILLSAFCTEDEMLNK